MRGASCQWVYVAACRACILGSIAELSSGCLLCPTELVKT